MFECVDKNTGGGATDTKYDGLAKLKKLLIWALFRRRSLTGKKQRFYRGNRSRRSLTSSKPMNARLECSRTALLLPELLRGRTMKPNRLMFALAAVLLVSSCAVAPPPPSYQPIAATAPTSSLTHEYRKNYEIGVPRSAAVGDTIVSVKDYYIATSTAQKIFTASNGFRALLSWAISADTYLVAFTSTLIPVAAEVVIDGRHYYLIEGKSPIGRAFNGIYIGDDGSIRTDRYHIRIPGSNEASGSDALQSIKIIPQNTTFTYSESKRSEIQSKGYINYDIVFTGKSGDQLNFVYREYSKDDFARQAFFQNLTYSASEPMIRFRNLRIRVESVNNEGIRYSVIED